MTLSKTLSLHSHIFSQGFRFLLVLFTSNFGRNQLTVDQLICVWIEKQWFTISFLITFVMVLSDLIPMHFEPWAAAATLNFYKGICKERESFRWAISGNFEVGFTVKLWFLWPFLWIIEVGFGDYYEKFGFLLLILHWGWVLEPYFHQQRLCFDLLNCKMKFWFTLFEGLLNFALLNRVDLQCRLGYLCSSVLIGYTVT